MCVVETQVHARASTKTYSTPISQPVWLGVGTEDPSGVVDIQAHSRGTLEKISPYIFSHKHMHVQTRPFHHIVCSLSLQAGISTLNLIKDVKKTPSQHAAPCNRIGGYPLQTRAHIATEINTQAAEIAFEDPTHSQSDGAKAPIAIHIRILVHRG